MEDGYVFNQIQNRGMTEDVIPYYPYRDDAQELTVVIRKYVTNVVRLIYRASRHFI